MVCDLGQCHFKKIEAAVQIGYSVSFAHRLPDRQESDVFPVACWASATTSEWDRGVTFLALVSSRPALHSERLLVATCYLCRENDSDCNQVSTIRIWLLLHRSFSFAVQDIRSHHRAAEDLLDLR